MAAIGLHVAVAAAQPQRESGTRPAFEAATIKLSTGPSRANIVTQPSPNRYSIPGMTLTALIYLAYGDGGFNTSMSVRGGPDWANRTVYAVEGVAAAPATPRQMRLMLQSLLEERFALKLHDASDTDAALGDVLTLVVDRSDGKLGPKVKPWDGTCPAAVPPMVMQAPRRPLQREGDQLIVGPASAADDPDMSKRTAQRRNPRTGTETPSKSTTTALDSVLGQYALLRRIVFKFSFRKFTISATMICNSTSLLGRGC